MKRRTFITTAFVAAAGAAAGLVAFGPKRAAKLAKRTYLQKFGPDDEEIARALEKSFAHVRLAPETALRFARDYRASRVGHDDPIQLPLNSEVRMQFLLSTNFVQLRGDAEKTVSYVQLYSPYESPCYNPFMFVERPGTVV